MKSSSLVGLAIIATTLALTGCQTPQKTTLTVKTQPPKSKQPNPGPVTTPSTPTTSSPKPAPAPAPSFTLIYQPQNQSAYPFQTVTFNVAVSKSGSFTYAWYRVGQTSPLQKGNSNQLTLSNLAAANAGDYYVVVTDNQNQEKVKSNTAHLTVTPCAALLTWQAPTTREDGSALALSELKGYNVYFTTNKAALTGTSPALTPVTLGASASDYCLKTLAAGTWYFAVQAQDTAGNLSPLSSVVSKTIP